MAPTASIIVDAALKARLTDLARQAGQEVDEFVGALLRRVAEADVRFERGLPAFPRRAGAPVLKLRMSIVSRTVRTRKRALQCSPSWTSSRVVGPTSPQWAGKGRRD